MKQLTCEMCGGADLVKDGGVFICQTCGCKYTVEEAKKMMVEGTVDVKGTVKVDRSSEVDNILKNADTTFGDGNYKEAFDLYSQAMNIDPDNAHAVLYRAVSSAWQSTVKDCRIVEVNKASERAFKLKHDQVGDTKEYFLFANDALNKTSSLINAISNMYIRYYNKAKPTNLTISGAIATSGIAAQVKQTMENGVSNCCIVSSNFPTFILNPVSDYSESFDGIWNSMEVMVKNAKQYRSNARMSSDSGLDRKLDEIQKLRRTAEDQRKKHQEEKRDAYWTEHADEKASLEAEKEKLEAENQRLESEIRSIEAEENGLASKKSYDDLNSRISAKRSELGSLGLFKGKEKKALQAEIDQLEKDKSSAGEVYRKDSDAIKERTKPLYAEKKSNSTRIDEIKKEFSKDR